MDQISPAITITDINSHTILDNYWMGLPEWSMLVDASSSMMDILLVTVG